MSAEVAIGWELLPGLGIRRSGTEVLLGSRRKEVRALMERHFASRENRRKGEDQYANESVTIFLRYETKKLTAILFVEGSLRYDGLELFATTWPALAAALATRGLAVDDDPAYFAGGVDVPALGVNVATADDTGGDGDEIDRIALWHA